MGDQIISEQEPCCLIFPFTLNLSSKSEKLSDLELKLSVNGKIRQQGSCSDMIWSPIDILSELKSKVPLSQGDLIYTGTPKGVASVKSGDIIDASITDKTNLSFKII